MGTRGKDAAGAAVAVERGEPRINESLDFETVLGGVMDSARVLTGSRYG